ncbi:hypothetical protein ANCCAN_25718 [Ancylostoma caninum]|uniref:Uncharacterized protein n=1 Tax=Ancylostoma caninum TaxID=29170 RepID=A0A368FAA1_ANCCA|nr:hypothetical protein ANCCAN_25718 [Ancylostoma caninum]
MDAELRRKIMDRHRKYQPAARGDFEIPKYDCKLEKIAKLYLDEPWTPLSSEYGSIKGLGKRGKSIDENLDEAFKAYEWNKLKEAAEGGHGREPLIPEHYGCYYDGESAVLVCIYDARIWRADY